ncbi:acyl-CoA N-acyltransferase [Chiua virens]|nr:acyl-CoA N-acyltransferase [Chiua virens]
MSAPTTVPYDFNFDFPVRELENDRVRLSPFIPSQHAELFFQGSLSHSTLYQHLPFGPFTSATDFVQQLIYDRIQLDRGMILYAIIDKTKSSRTPGSTDANIALSSADFAGIVGYLNGSPVHLKIEIGFVIVLPSFQRTHVTTNAVGLLLRYALDLPTATPPGLGLRRVQWQASERNDASIRVAERMGFTKEGLLRWERMFPGDQGKAGNGEDIREGDPRAGTIGRHTVMLAMCWDDWGNGWRDQVAQLMDR